MAAGREKRFGRRRGRAGRTCVFGGGSKRAAAQGGYGAANSSTWVEVGAGERMVDHAVAKIYEMLGRLTDAPQVLERK